MSPNETKQRENPETSIQKSGNNSCEFDEK